MKIKKLNQKQMQEIYQLYMVIDFPEDELKPMHRIVSMMEQGIYECTGLYDEQNELCAYAFFVVEREQGDILLDYLAVLPDRRCNGIGSIYLESMQPYFPGFSGILIESESEYGATVENLDIRRRRLDFYRRNGAVLTPVKSQLFGVDYSILYIPIACQKQQEDRVLSVYARLNRIYALMFPEKYVKKGLVKSWIRNRAIQFVRVDQKPVASLAAALGLDLCQPPALVAFVGGGGKTTSILQLADELAEAGRRVIVTTSTHIGRPLRKQILTIDDVREQSAELEKAYEGIGGNGNILVVAKQLTESKYQAPKHVEDLVNFADVVLVEADGARCLPFKIPAAHEPVIPETAELVVACVGLDAIGQTIQAACFRYEQQFEKEKEKRITPELVANVLSSDTGSHKQVGERPYRILLNKADTKERLELAYEVICHLPENKKNRCVITGYEI